MENYDWIEEFANNPAVKAVTLKGIVRKKMVQEGSRSQWSYYVLEVGNFLKKEEYLLNDYSWRITRTVPNLNLPYEELVLLENKQVKVSALVYETNSLENKRKELEKKAKALYPKYEEAQKKDIPSKDREANPDVEGWSEAAKSLSEITDMFMTKTSKFLIVKKISD